MRVVPQRPSPSLYNAALQACAERGACGDAALAATLLGRMHKFGVPRDAGSYSSAIQACAAAGEPGRCHMLTTVDVLLTEASHTVRDCLTRGEIARDAISTCADAGHWRGALMLLGGNPPGLPEVCEILMLLLHHHTIG